jgi:Fe-S cluster biogenesis protein NfuA
MVNECMNRIEGLLQVVESMPDEKTRGTVRELLQSLMDLHGAGLDRMMEIAADAGEGGLQIIEAYGRDDLVNPLLLLYGLHPADLESRVLQALEKVRPYLKSHGGNVELVGIESGIATLRLRGSCQGCSSSTVTLKSTIEEAIYQAAPDVVEIRVEEAVQPHPAGFVPLDSLMAN